MKDEPAVHAAPPKTHTRPDTTVSRRDRIEPIPDTPENIARAIMSGPPKKEWRYIKGDSAGRDRSSRS